jgi:hypothetical protein
MFGLFNSVFPAEKEGSRAYSLSSRGIGQADTFFLVVVVAGNRLYTTTTTGLWERLRFRFGVWGGLQAGCGVFLKQYRTSTLTYNN